MLRLIRAARKQQIDFVYGFHPGEDLRFTDDRAIGVLLRKAQRFYDAGVRTFAVLFDDISSRLSDPRDRRAFKNSLARAEGTWLAKVIAAQPASSSTVEGEGRREVQTFTSILSFQLVVIKSLTHSLLLSLSFSLFLSQDVLICFVATKAT